MFSPSMSLLTPTPLLLRRYPHTHPSTQLHLTLEASPFPGAPSFYIIKHTLFHWEQKQQFSATYVAGITDQPMYILWLVV